MATKNQLVFDIGADSGGAKKALADLRSQFDATINALKSRSGEITLFKAAQQDAAKLEAQIAKLGKAGGDTSGLTTALTAQRAALAQQSASLQKVGINTNQLNAEQARLRVQADQVTRTFRTQSAALGASNGLAAGLAGFRSVIAGISTFAPQLAGAFAVVGLEQFVKGIIDAQARLFELKQITGLSVPTLAGLSLVAKQSGTDVEALAKGVGLFSKVVGAAKDPSSAQAKLLGELGINATEAEPALLQIADLFASMPDGLEKDNIALHLFGKAGAQLIPAFNGGADSIRKMLEEAKNLNGATDESAKKFHEFDDALIKLGAQAKGFGAQVALPIVSGMTKIIDVMNDKKIGNIKGAWLLLGALGTELFTDQSASLEKLNKQLDLAQAQLAGGVATAAVAPLKAYIAQLKEKIATEERSNAQDAKQDPAKAARLATQQRQSADLIKIKEFETAKIKDALDKQEEAYRQANSAINKSEDDRVALAEKNAARILALTTPKVADKNLIAPEITSSNLDANAAARNEAFRNQAEARTQLIDLQSKANAALAKAINPADFDQVVTLGEQASVLIEKLNAAGANAPSVLAAQQKAIADIQDKALQGKGKAEEDIADKTRVTVEDLKKKLKAFEEIPIGIDLAKSEQAIIDAMANMQRLLDATPLRVKMLPTVEAPPAQGQPLKLAGHAAGAILPGYGGGDRWPVLVESGEAIIRKEAVRHYGPNLMAALNAMALARFAEGGIIERSVSRLPQISASGVGGSDRAPINLILDGNRYAMEASAAVADSLQAAIRNAALKHGRRR